MQIECYAQRLLNPFRGAAHTIRYRSAEALTTDGVEWDIYVANDALLDGLGRAGKRAQISDIRYGHWSAETGLKRGPLFPSDDFRRLEDMGAVVYENLLTMHRAVPFAFLDQFELWLLDRRDRPLALLHANPAHTAWVRIRHFRTASQRIAQMHVDVLFGSEDMQMLEVLSGHLDDVEAAWTGTCR
jgi:hypothetical protein